MHARALAALAFTLGMVAGCGAGARKPCAWYFASHRASTTQGPIGWLSGVWKGHGPTGHLLWTRLHDDVMAGLWRREEAPGEVRFYTLRRDGTNISLVELSTDGVANTYEAVEQGERFVVFANPQLGRIGFRYSREHAALIWTIERAGVVESHRLRLEV